MTTYTGPTPYDAEVVAAAKEAMQIGPAGFEGSIRLSIAQEKATGYRRGRTDAKAEDAALLEAAKTLVEAEQHVYPSDDTHFDDLDAYMNALRALEVAIAQAQAKEWPMHYHISGDYESYRWYKMREGPQYLHGEWRTYGLDEAVEVAQGLTNAQVTKCTDPKCPLIVWSRLQANTPAPTTQGDK